MKEVWKKIPGYEGIYDVSNLGRVKSLRCNKIMSLSKSSTGYLHIQLYKDKKYKTHTIHSLVANAFIPNIYNKPEINHIDGNKENNNVSNLEWSTKSENQIHAIKLGLRRPSPMIGIKGAKNRQSKKVIQYSLDGNFIHVWDSISDAARHYLCSPSCITSCIKGRHKTCAGYMWKPFTGNDYANKIPKVSYNKHQYTKPTFKTKQRKCKQILQLSLSGEIIKKWDSYIELINKTGFNNANIYNCINGKIRTAYGYIWKYAEE